MLWKYTLHPQRIPQNIKEKRLQNDFSNFSVCFATALPTELQTKSLNNDFLIRDENFFCFWYLGYPPQPTLTKQVFLGFNRLLV